MVTIANFAKVSSDNDQNMLEEDWSNEPMEMEEYLENNTDEKGMYKEGSPDDGGGLEEKPKKVLMVGGGIQADIFTGDNTKQGHIDPGVLASDNDSVVIPRGLNYGNLEIQRKGVKNTYYCEVCYTQLSSLETMKSHTNGAKHQKKMLTIQKERDDKMRSGLVVSEKMPGVIQVPNPESAKVKVPRRLQERVRDTEEPAVGLRYIREFLTMSDPEMEPFYRCELCGSQGTSNSIFSHLMGFKHRQALVDIKYGGGRTKALSQVCVCLCSGEDLLTLHN